MSNGNINVRSIRQQSHPLIDLFVQISRMSDGSRRVTYMTECVGMEGEQVTTQDLFVFEKTGSRRTAKSQGDSAASGVRPKFSERLKAAGYRSTVQSLSEFRRSSLEDGMLLISGLSSFRSSH